MTDEKRTFDKINLSAKRGPEESFRAYKKRMKVNRKLLEKHLRGYHIWLDYMGPAVRRQP